MSKYNNLPIGYLFQRKIVVNPKISNLEQSLELSLLEVKIMILTVKHFIKNDLVHFDATIGDRKCQTRASMILDLFDNEENVKKELLDEKYILNILVEKIKKSLESVSSLSQAERVKLARELNPLSKYYELNELTFKPSSALRLLSLCLLTTLPEKTILNLSNNKLSLRKVRKVINHGVKTSLCHLSVNYEQNLAKKYGNEEFERALSQIEYKGFCFMTACYPGIEVILEKIKQKKQLLLFKSIHFCTCHNIKNEYLQLLKFENDKLVKLSIDKNLAEGALIIESYNFPGSFKQFQEKYNISQYTTRLPKSYHKGCSCSQPTAKAQVENPIEGLLAHFAQHPQFTTDDDIDFEGLGLVSSDLQKEYEYLKSLKGFSFHDMSQLFLTHISASIVKDALKTELAPSLDQDL